METYYDVGKIVNTQGLKGEVRVISQTDFPEERYQVGQHLTLFIENKLVKELVIASYRRHKNFDILRFEGHDSINDVEVYRNGQLKVSESDLHELSENEFYYHEIIGLPVLTEEGETLGTVKEILSPGANDVWVVTGENGGEILLPYIESVVKEVNVTAGTIVVEVPEGLIDDAD